MAELSKIILANIKSSYITKGIFSYLEQKQKLDMIIYNKELQKILNVNIEDYKEMSEKYRIGERDRKGKEYDYDGEVKFEGEYLNGKRNGKGKEYDDEGRLEFEGEYLNEKEMEKEKNIILNRET